MALSEKQKGEFVDAYTKVLLASWADEEYAARLEHDPRAAFAEVGLRLPADATIVVDTGSVPTSEIAEPEARLQRQVDSYEAGFVTGRFEFHMPSTPQLDTSELDPVDLEKISAGLTCCCCPCCCCG